MANRMEDEGTRSTAYASPPNAVFVLAAAIFIVESFLAYTLHARFDLSPFLEALLNSILLAAAVSPLLYFLVYRPLKWNLDERKKAEHEYELLFTMPLDMICIAGNDGFFKKVNPAFTAILGFSEKELLERPFAEFIHPADRQTTLAEVEKQLKGGVTLDFENRFLCKNGSYKWLSWKAVAVGDHLYATARDITARKAAENALRLESEITANAAEGITLVRQLDGVIIYVNRQLESMLGYSPGELAGKHISVKNAPTEKSSREITDAIARELKEKGIWSGEILNLRKDGTTFWTFANLSTFNHYEHGTVWLALHTDITERKKAEAERDRFFTISLDMLGIAGVDGYFKRVNSAFERTLGYTAEEFLSRPWMEFVHPDDREAALKAANKILGGESTVNFQNRYMCKDGSIRWLDWSVVPYPPEGLVYAVARDVTEQRRHEAALHAAKDKAEESERLKSEFLANMSHELNTPLTSILGFSKIAIDTDKQIADTLTGIINLLDELGGSPVHSPAEIQARSLAARTLAEETANYSKIVTEQGQTLFNMLNDLMMLSQLVSGQARVFNDMISARMLLASLENNRKYAALKGLSFSVNSGAFHSKDLLFFADVKKLEKVLSILLGNAIKYCDSGNVTVTISLRAENIAFSVQDTGIGIQERELERIFEVLHQVDGSTTRKRGGVGLGLSLAKRLVDIMGGAISVKSEIGKGSEFTVNLPYRPAPAKIGQ